MNSFFYTHRKGLVLAFNLFFWLITCVFFVRFATLRPICNTNIYKEFLCVGTIAAVVLLTQRLTVPKLFMRGRYGAFWLVSVCLLLFASSFEMLLVKPDILGNVQPHLGTTYYILMIYISVFFRDSCFFAWFLVSRLYILQKDSFRAKQRASVMEHRSVQFSTPDHKEISIPIDIIIYMQDVDHTTRIHCTNGNVITVAEPLSYCKEMIPAALWVSDGSDKMVFHQHLSDFFQTQNNQETVEIKTVILLKKKQFQVFEIIRKNPGCGIAFIADKFPQKTTTRTIERYLAELREKDVIVYTGSKKTGGYTVNQTCVVQED